MVKVQESTSMLLLVTLLVNLTAIVLANPVKQGNGAVEDSAMRTLYDANEESLNRFVNDPSYRAGYERAVYDLYYGRVHDLVNTDHIYPSPAKKAIDLGLGRFSSGSRTANGLLALDSANFAGGPGRK
ncbi:uncharacterized protein LOC129591320 [Paramacrobiotus metropolitanus]|uniref:uncharacterized protein LOC129591320 n=1 Tax=Paramacrobiotus metropolitanus TaxID=2943436 RepID=UPI0024465A26|nr:uncharacterized protein LOC129591320 [Paramacrobiotus metropolitanus]